MKRKILAKLRNILAELYPDDSSIRRVTHDTGLDLARVAFSSTAINSWHSVLIEAEKMGLVNVLLTVVEQEYGSNQEFLNVCWDVQTDDNFVDQNQINFFIALGSWKEVHSLLFKAQTRTADTKALQEKFQNFDWGKAEQAYLDKVVNLYDRVRVLGNPVDIPLGNLFTQVYILDKPTSRYRHDIEELRKRGHDRYEFQRQPGERIHGLDLVKRGQNLFILGKPGSGKTTFLKYITIQAVRKQLSRIPIFVSLNQWADSFWGKGDQADLLPFLVEQFDVCDFPDPILFLNYLLREGRVLVLFDGLDEVKEEKDQRRRLTRLLQDFANRFSKSQYLITCRIAASDYAFTRFTDVEVADFTRNQVYEYAHKWFSENDKKLDAFTMELAKSENQGLAELCNTPLLLSMLCLTFDNNMRFPPNRAELYEDALETLLRKWDSSRAIQRDIIYRELSHKRKLQLLMSIAVPTFQKGELFFLQRYLEQWIVDYLEKLPAASFTDLLDGATILKTMETQHCILVERAQGIYSFSHLTFQEYLTARYLVENQRNRVIEELIHNHLTERRWREVFLLSASLLADADGFINAMYQAIDGIAAGVPQLIRLLTLVYERTQHINVSIEKHIIVRLAYIYLSFARSTALSSSRNSKLTLRLELVLDLFRSFKTELGGTFDLATEVAYDLIQANKLDHAEFGAITPFQSRAIVRYRDLKQIHQIAQVTTPLVGFDYGLYYAYGYANLFGNTKVNHMNEQAVVEFPKLISSIVALADEAGLTNLAQELTGYTIPKSYLSRYDWQQYAYILHVILNDERDLGREWPFSDEENGKLNDYFYANELLIQCLNVTAISDRQAVLQGLLLPPEARQISKKIGRREETKGDQP